MTRTSKVVRRSAAASVCALVAFAFVVMGPSQFAFAEDVFPTDPGTTSPAPEPEPSPEDPPLVPPTIPPLEPSPEAPAPPAEPAPSPENPAPAPVPAPVVPPANNAAPADLGTVPGQAPVTVEQPQTDGGAADSQEAAPAADKASPTPAPGIVPETSKAAAPAALPEPVAKTIDAVVSTASGSPLYVQLITVLVLIAAGIVYFRVLGSKGPRAPSKSAK